MNDEDIKTVRTFLDALGYEKRDNGIWKYTKTYKMPAKTYSEPVLLDELDLKDMSLNDALLFVIDTKRTLETKLEFKMKYDIEYVGDFVSQFDCPTCPK